MISLGFIILVILLLIYFAKVKIDNIQKNGQKLELKHYLFALLTFLFIIIFSFVLFWDNEKISNIPLAMIFIPIWFESLYLLNSKDSNGKLTLIKILFAIGFYSLFLACLFLYIATSILENHIIILKAIYSSLFVISLFLAMPSLIITQLIKFTKHYKNKTIKKI